MMPLALPVMGGDDHRADDFFVMPVLFAAAEEIKFRRQTSGLEVTH